jgi:methylmalonyl-CoA/ethylmalonyl-CoA epimerase
VESIEDAVAELRKMRYIVVRKPEPAIAFGNKRVCFLYHKQVGLIEIVEQ